MSNPVAKLSTYSYEGVWYEKTVYVWCPGCDDIHPFRIAVNPESPTYGQRKNSEVWTWDGNLESPTFSPSLVVEQNVCICPEDYDHYEICELGNDCEALGHAYLHPDRTPVRWDEERQYEKELLGHNKGHIVPPGNCHSFVKNGQWVFLGDCAHKLADQTVPLPPLPSWWLGDDSE